MNTQDFNELICDIGFTQTSVGSAETLILLGDQPTVKMFSNDEFIINDEICGKTPRCYNKILDQLAEISPWMGFVRISGVDCLLNQNGFLYKLCSKLFEKSVSLTRIPPYIFKRTKTTKKATQ